MIDLKTITIHLVGSQDKAGLKTNTAHFCETVNKNDIKKKWDCRLQGPNHTHPIVRYKAKGIRRTDAAVMKTVSMLKSCRKMHKFTMKIQIYPVKLCAMQEGKTPWPQAGLKNES